MQMAVAPGLCGEDVEQVRSSPLVGRPFFRRRAEKADSGPRDSFAPALPGPQGMRSGGYPSTAAIASSRTLRMPALSVSGFMAMTGCR